jgi:arginine decarboxylase-like protein
MAGVTNMSVGIDMGDSKRHSRPSEKKSVQPDFLGRMQNAFKKSHNQSSATARISISHRCNKMNKAVNKRLDEMSRVADNSKLQFDQLTLLVNSLSSELSSSRSTVKELQQQLHDNVILNNSLHSLPPFVPLNPR